MRHRRHIKRLGRTQGARRALLRGLARSLVKHGRIETSASSAKELRGFVDRLVGLAKKDTLAAHRRILADLGDDKKTVEGLLKIVPGFSQRTSGFTRLIPLGERRGDNSMRTRIEWTDKVEKALKVPNISKVSKASQKADEKIKIT